jgi:hypothetical protein
MATTDYLEAVVRTSIYRPNWYYLQPARSAFCRLIFFFNGSIASVGLGSFFSLLIYSQSVGLLGRVISSSQDLYLNTGENKHIYTPHINALSVIRTHDHSVRASECSSCLRPLDYRDRLASERAKAVHALDRSTTVTG